MAKYVYSIDNPSHRQVRDIRNRCAHYLSEEVASHAEISMPQLQQFCIGAIDLTPTQLHRLALRTQIYQELTR